jgi:hypothetical protein
VIVDGSVGDVVEVVDVVEVSGDVVEVSGDVVEVVDVVVVVDPVEPPLQPPPPTPWLPPRLVPPPGGTVVGGVVVRWVPPATGPLVREGCEGPFARSGVAVATRELAPAGLDTDLEALAVDVDTLPGVRDAGDEPTTHDAVWTSPALAVDGPPPVEQAAWTEPPAWRAGALTFGVDASAGSGSGAVGVGGATCTPTLPRMPSTAREADPGSPVAADSPVVAIKRLAMVVAATTAGVRRTRKRRRDGHDSTADRKAVRAASSPWSSWAWAGAPAAARSSANAPSTRSGMGTMLSTSAATCRVGSTIGRSRMETVTFR